MNLVVDASVAVAAVATPMGFARFQPFTLIAPPLMWIEAYSVLHSTLWRGEIDEGHALTMRARIDAAPIHRVAPKALGEGAWSVADEMGWAKTYDANYVALARLRDCRLVTVDGRLRRGAERLGFVVGPNEL